MKQSKSDIELHKKEQNVEKPTESTQQKDAAPTVDKESPQKEAVPVEEVHSQPHLMQQKEIQEKKPEVVKDISADERDTAAKDVKKIDSSEIPELETVQMPQEKETPKPVTPKEKPKQVEEDTKQVKKEDASVKKEAPKPEAPVALKEKPEEIAAESKQVKKEDDYAKKDNEV